MFLLTQQQQGGADDGDAEHHSEHGIGWDEDGLQTQLLKKLNKTHTTSSRQRQVARQHAASAVPTRPHSTQHVESLLQHGLPSHPQPASPSRSGAPDAAGVHGMLEDLLTQAHAAVERDQAEEVVLRDQQQQLHHHHHHHAHTAAGRREPQQPPAPAAVTGLLAPADHAQQRMQPSAAAVLHNNRLSALLQPPPQALLAATTAGGASSQQGNAKQQQQQQQQQQQAGAGVRRMPQHRSGLPVTPAGRTTPRQAPKKKPRFSIRDTPLSSQHTPGPPTTPSTAPAARQQQQQQQQQQHQAGAATLSALLGPSAVTPQRTTPQQPHSAGPHGLFVTPQPMRGSGVAAAAGGGADAAGGRADAAGAGHATPPPTYRAAAGAHEQQGAGAMEVDAHMPAAATTAAATPAAAAAVTPPPAAAAAAAAAAAGGGHGCDSRPRRASDVNPLELLSASRQRQLAFLHALPAAPHPAAGPAGLGINMSASVPPGCDLSKVWQQLQAAQKQQQDRLAEQQAARAAAGAGTATQQPSGVLELEVCSQSWEAHLVKCLCTIKACPPQPAEAPPAQPRLGGAPASQQQQRQQHAQQPPGGDAGRATSSTQQPQQQPLEQPTLAMGDRVWVFLNSKLGATVDLHPGSRLVVQPPWFTVQRPVGQGGSPPVLLPYLLGG